MMYSAGAEGNTHTEVKQISEKSSGCQGLRKNHFFLGQRLRKNLESTSNHLSSVNGKVSFNDVQSNET